MDNLTHSLIGLALARAGLNRTVAGATAILLISANIPDIDVIGLAFGPLKYLEVHRAYTHSLIGLPVMAVLSVALAALILRRRLPILSGFGLACIGLASHLFLDWTNSYGIRLLLPFSSRWYHLDWDVLTDYPLVAMLLFAFVWPYFGRLVSGEIGARRRFGRGLPAFALFCVLVLEAIRAFTHAKSVAQLNTVLYDDAPAMQIAALPTRVNPWLWRAVIETRSAYLEGNLNLLTESEPPETHSYLKLPRDEAVNAVLRTGPFRYFQYFARFPVWTEQPGSTSGLPTTRLDLTDLRFGSPDAGAFHCVALVSAANQVLESQFTYGDGADLGWAMNAKMKP